MKNICIIISILIMCSCQEKSSYLKDIYYKENNNYIIKLQEKDTINNYFEDSIYCSEIKKNSLKFIIYHEDGKSLEGLFFNIYIGQKKIYSDYFLKEIVSQDFNICYDNKLGNYVWFYGYDTLNKLSYSWGQKNSIPIKQEYKIKLLQKENNDGDNYIIEN